MDSQDGAHMLDVDGEDGEDTTETCEDTSILTLENAKYHLTERLRKLGCKVGGDDERLNINRRRLNDILTDFGLPDSTDVNCSLSDNPTFKEIIDYIIQKTDTLTEDLTAEQNYVTTAL